MKVSISRIWAMPNKWTFTIKPIRELIEQEAGSGFMVKGSWVDPFAGENSPAQLRNDINPSMPAESHQDALSFLKSLETNTYDGVLYDPPYSIHQAKEVYDGFGKEKLEINVANMAYWKGCKDEISRIIKPGGKVICFGWSSNGLGKGRGFEMTRVLLVPHGGSKNDTIVTVETRETLPNAEAPTGADTHIVQSNPKEKG